MHKSTKRKGTGPLLLQEVHADSDPLQPSHVDLHWLQDVFVDSYMPSEHSFKHVCVMDSLNEWSAEQSIHLDASPTSPFSEHVPQEGSHFEQCLSALPFVV